MISKHAKDTREPLTAQGEQHLTQLLRGCGEWANEILWELQQLAPRARCRRVTQAQLVEAFRSLIRDVLEHSPGISWYISVWGGDNTLPKAFLRKAFYVEVDRVQIYARSSPVDGTLGMWVMLGRETCKASTVRKLLGTSEIWAMPQPIQPVVENESWLMTLATYEPAHANRLDIQRKQASNMENQPWPTPNPRP